MTYLENEKKTIEEKEKKQGHLIKTSFSIYEFTLLFVPLVLLFDKIKLVSEK